MNFSRLVLLASALMLASWAHAQAPAEPAAAPAPPPKPPTFETKKVDGTDNVYVFRYQNSQSMFVVTPAGVIATDPIGYGLSLIHISEPTRLLSISYAVFCLKKKKK